MKPSHQSPDHAARLHLATHHQVISHAEAVACGLTDRQIAYRARRGEWTRLCRGVYAATNAPDTWQRRARAAQVAGPPGTVLSHLTAAALHGLGSPPLLPHVTVPPGTSGRPPLAVVHRGLVPIVDTLNRNALPATGVARTIVDCAGILSRAALADIVDAALCDRLATPGTVIASLERAGRRRGRRILLDVLEVWDPTIEPGSTPEVRLLRRLEDWGYGRPESQHDIFDEAGDFVARVDLAWPDAMVAIEYDGRATHAPRVWTHDEERQQRAERLGWRFARVSKLDLMPGDDDLRVRLDRVFRGPVRRSA